MDKELKSLTSLSLLAESPVRLLRHIAKSLKSDGRRPRVHGNGFVQLDLSDTLRMHVWGDARVRPQLIPSTIHDHTFSFSSQIVRGQLVHREMNAHYDPRGAYRMYRALTSSGEDRRLRAAGSPSNRFNTLVFKEVLLTEGSTYEFEAGRFHETLAPWSCVTVIEKTETGVDSAPRVLVPHNLSPDETFDRYQMDVDLLWQIVFDALEV